jgi:hypothetical protein
MLLLPLPLIVNPAIEIAAVDDDDPTVAGADEISVDRSVSGVVEGLSRAGDGVELHGRAAAVDLSGIGEDAVAGAAEEHAGAAVTADLSIVGDGRGPGDVDSPHALDDGAGTVADLPAAAEHDGIAAAHIELRAGQHVDGHVGATRLRHDPRRHRIGLAAVAGHGLTARRRQGRCAGGARGIDRPRQRGRRERQSGNGGTQPHARLQRQRA